MGWTGLYRERGMTNRDFYRRELLDDRHEILDCATIGNVFYAAIRNAANGGIDDGEVWALVVLQQLSRGTCNLYYKDLSEDMGPNEARCPDRILDLLTETTNEYALEWRKRCRTNNAAKTAKGTIRVGETVRFTQPENLAAFGAMTRIDPRKGIFRTETGGRVYVPWWRTASWTAI